MHTSFDDLSLVLGEIALFRGLSPVVVGEVARASQVLSLPKGRVVYAAGDRPRGIYHVMSGHLKTAVSSPDGGEKVIEILSPRQAFGVAELFADAACVSTVETVTPVVLLAVGREGIFRAMEQEPEVARRMLSAMAERQSSIERDIAADCFQSGTAKVVDYLARLAAESGHGAGRVALELEIPKHVLAARLGFTPETLSRIFRELSDAGMIHVHGKQVTLLEAFSRQHRPCPVPRQGAAGAARRTGQPAGNWFERAAGYSEGRMVAWG
ncbi:MAG: Crp/Fnr family transcriptional regulator [Proteobacteria bacterium]|nr:Crp/Fnr family transcriptional regulator [Pseudomonadota bacterium]